MLDVVLGLDGKRSPTLPDKQKYLDLLFGHIAKDVVLQPADQLALAAVAQVRMLERKEAVLAPGQVSRHMRFIASGCMQAYYLDANLQEHTLQLGIEGWWVNDLYSYLTEKPSRLYVQAQEPTVLVQLPKSGLETLYQEVPAVKEFFRLKIQSGYVALLERTVQQLSESAQMRYASFQKHQRELEQRFPQYVVASYLGMTREFLSALRKKMQADIP